MRRLLQVVLVAMALILLPLSGADAKKGDNNAGGSDRSDEVRQNDGNNGNNGNNDGGNGGGGNDGTGTPDDGDNMHPSGNDKSVEPGGSYPQGHSQSDPDGMSNGGADKPGGTGGIDQDDQDGNNGCGNDDDFEDDNNGNCGGPKKDDVPETETEATPVEVTPSERPFALRTIVLTEPAFREVVTSRPTVVVEPEGEALSSTQIEPAVAVAGVAEEAEASVGGGGTGTGLLPRTGSAIESIVILALMLMILGSIALGASRRFTPRSG